MSINNIVHSVTLDNDKCKGCTNCVKRCPTAAIRVRDKKAIILDYKCIDCGECIRVCPHHAKKAEMDQLSAVLDEFDYTIALPAPTLYGQFPGVRDRNIILTALKHIGFDDVFEVAAAAEMVSAATRRNIMAGKLPRPAISSACPTVVRIIRARFPSLLPHLIPYHAPMELAARWAKRLATEKTGLPEEKIGCVFISPCTAKCSSIKMPFGTEKSSADAAVSISDIYTKLLSAIKNVDEPEDLASSWRTGVGWAVSGGECAGAKEQNYLAADGMENVISILEKLDDEKIQNVDLIELNACVGGCVGGVLTVENPFIAKRRLGRLMTLMRPAMHPPGLPKEPEMIWEKGIEYVPVLQLDSDITVAMQKLARVKELEEKFCGMDCGACGAPSCRTFAEDIVKGQCTEDQCIFLMREKLQKLLAEKEEKDNNDS